MKERVVRSIGGLQVADGARMGVVGHSLVAVHRCVKVSLTECILWEVCPWVVGWMKGCQVS